MKWYYQVKQQNLDQRIIINKNDQSQENFHQLFQQCLMNLKLFLIINQMKAGQISKSSSLPKKQQENLESEKKKKAQTMLHISEQARMKNSSKQIASNDGNMIKFAQSDNQTNFIFRKSIDTHQQYSFKQGKSMRQEAISLPKKQEIKHKKVLVLYTSGSSGANENIEIHRGFLKAKMKDNQYLCDEKIMQSFDVGQNFLVTPEQQNGIRIFYEVEQFSKINPSINVSLEQIKQIAQLIHKNYKKYDAFIVLCGFDVICYISTLISFMLENLSKLVIFTGGYFPISYMRNDTVNNINESFSIISLADNFNDVIIVCKNKGYRANRSIKMVEGSFGSVTSPNLQALVSVNIKIKFREHLYLSVPKNQFSIWTSVSQRVGIVKFHILLNKQALEYELANPLCDGFVIESYGSSNIPIKQQILEVFKKIAQEKDKIFVNVAQPITKVNSSVMKDYFQKYHIYFGGDMTTQAVLSKLSYLLSKKYSRQQIKKYIYTNMRGQLSEMNSENQFQIQHPSFMQLIEQSLHKYYPSNYYKQFIKKIQNALASFIPQYQNTKIIEILMKKIKKQEINNQQQYKELIIRLVDDNYLLHEVVKASNQNLYRYFLNFSINVNKVDENQCSPLYYAIVSKDKKAIQYLSRKGCKIICHEDDLFELIIRELKQDDYTFFQLLYHVQFKETLKDLTNYEDRTVLHLAVLLKAKKSLKYIQQKFKINPKHRDSYGKTYNDYLVLTKQS